MHQEANKSFTKHFLIYCQYLKSKLIISNLIPIETPRTISHSHKYHKFIYEFGKYSKEILKICWDFCIFVKFCNIFYLKSDIRGFFFTLEWNLRFKAKNLEYFVIFVSYETYTNIKVCSGYIFLYSMYSGVSNFHNQN